MGPRPPHCDERQAAICAQEFRSLSERLGRVEQGLGEVKSDVTEVKTNAAFIRGVLEGQQRAAMIVRPRPSRKRRAVEITIGASAILGALNFLKDLLLNRG